MVSSLDEVQSNFGELAIKYKMELRLFLFSATGLRHITFAALPILSIAGFKRKKKNTFIRNRNIYPSKIS